MTYRGLDRLRRATQVAFLLLPAGIAALAWMERPWIVGSYYGLSLFGLPVADPLMALQALLLNGGVPRTLLLGAALAALTATIFGRVFCSWACPYNTLHELLPPRRRPPTNPSRLAYWGVFAALLVLVPLAGTPFLALLSPPGLISSQTTHGLLGLGIGAELGLVGVLFVAERLARRRFWCRGLCPVGACLALFRGPWTLRLVHEPERCHCRGRIDPCGMSCPLGLAPKRADLYPACFNCARCARTCQRTGHGSLRLAFRRRG